MTESRAVVVEDDQDIAALVRGALLESGLDVSIVRNGVDGLTAALEERTDLLVLDLMLPGMDGLELCRRVRAARPELLVLMLTAKTSELDRVLGLELGADDYLTKPFSLRELQARVKALFRRQTSARLAQDTVATIDLGTLRIDVASRSVMLRGASVQLTQREFDLLTFLARHPNQVFTRFELLDRVWGAGFDGFAHTVNSHINRLRTKVERDPAEPVLIQTVWGRGYKLVPPG